jgi:hypothetical protein
MVLGARKFKIEGVALGKGLLAGEEQRQGE